ncbi:cation:proton antiporter domain-containing protein [Streptomyces mirabilis]
MNTNGTGVESLELIVVVAVGVLAMSWLSRRTGLSEPLLLLGAGCLVGLTPPFAGFALSPEVVLFLFLPALLYWEALTSSVREIRNNFRSIAPYRPPGWCWPPRSPSPPWPRPCHAAS